MPLPTRSRRRAVCFKISGEEGQLLAHCRNEVPAPVVALAHPHGLTPSVSQLALSHRWAHLALFELEAMPSDGQFCSYILLLKSHFASKGLRECKILDFCTVHLNQPGWRPAEGFVSG